MKPSSSKESKVRRQGHGNCTAIVRPAIAPDICRSSRMVLESLERRLLLTTANAALVADASVRQTISMSTPTSAPLPFYMLRTPPAATTRRSPS